MTLREARVDGIHNQSDPPDRSGYSTPGLVVAAGDRDASQFPPFDLPSGMLFDERPNPWPLTVATVPRRAAIFAAPVPTIGMTATPGG